MTDERKQEIIEAYKRLGTYKKVREELGVGLNTVWKAITEAGLNKGMGGNQDDKRKITDAELIEACKTMTCAEIAKKYGMHYASVPRRFKALGIKPIEYGEHNALKENWGKHNENLKSKRTGYGACWHYIKSQDELCKINHPNFIYLESRNGEPKRIRLKCKRCGEVIERAASTVRKKGVICDNCREQQKALAELQKTRVSLIRTFSRIAEQQKDKKCRYCGNVFHSQYAEAKYCSNKCRKQIRGCSSIKDRCKKYHVIYDKTITPIKVFERDHYICQICGLLCNKDDDTWNGYIGAYSPTIDHRIALANGGTHTWDNVQCAHAMCNSKKRDTR